MFSRFLWRFDKWTFWDLPLFKWTFRKIVAFYIDSINGHLGICHFLWRFDKMDILGFATY
jgi:hypothetical protein